MSVDPRSKLASILALMFSATSLANDMVAGDERHMHAIHIILGKQVISASLEDSPATRDLISQLPLSIDLADYSAKEKIAYLPHKLDTSGAPAGIDPDVGDVTYYAPWGNLAIFYRDFGYSVGLIKLGSITNGLEHLGYSGSRQAIIKLAPAKK
ncbi:cyclophilin-like fold protein [Pseudomonas guariconensis]|uniref:cyclophilin-like fold protein n=1 Tax=Pseudomonas guariconensis TaxID=1288410 RepID=UPI002E1E8CA6